MTSLVGRERETAETEGLLRTHRLLTLTGPGGSGKTRLALAVAGSLMNDYPEGVWLVELASLSDPELVPQAVAAVLGVREQPGRPLTEILIDALYPKRMLLVLDNCEHLVETCAHLVEALLTSCPSLRILATSREALGVVGEVNRVVPPLSVPEGDKGLTVEELKEYGAARLFVERALERTSAFTPTPENASAVAEVCRKLEGIPLAVELAAARVGTLAVEQIAARLEDSLKLLTGGGRMATPRQRTLRGALDWSFELLGEPERYLFARLSAFAGGWTLEAAEAVGAGPEGGAGEEDVLDLLSMLVDKSLVVAQADDSGGELRYRMLEPVRQYGREKLEEAGEAERVQERHAAYYLALTEEAEPESREQGAWLQRLETEHANFRAALGWALDAEQAGPEEEERAAAGLRLAVALGQGRFWAANGLSEGLRWLEKGLARSSSTLPDPIRATALNEAGWIATVQSDQEKALVLLEESFALSKKLKDKSGIAASLFQLGQLLVMHEGDRERVEALRREAETLRSEPLGLSQTAYLIMFLAQAAWHKRDNEQALVLFEEGLILFRDMGNLQGTAFCLGSLGFITLDGDEPTRAATIFEEALRTLKTLRDRVGIFHCLLGAASVAGLRGEPVRAARLWGAAEALGETAAVPLIPLIRSRYDYEGHLDTARSRLDEAAWTVAWAEGRAMSPEHAIEYALGRAGNPAPTPTTIPVSERSPSGTEEPAGMAPDEVKAPPERQPLRVFGFGSSRVEREGQPLTSSDWTHAKPKELLFYLLSHPEGRTKEQVGLALWPDASPSQLRSSFHRTLHHLRKALGRPEWISFKDKHYAFERALAGYSFDVEEFEEKLDQARRLKDEDQGWAISCLREAVELYKGDFLEDLGVEGEWALVRQEELRRAYGEALLSLGDLLFEEGRYAESAEVYRKVIAQDSYSEAAHRGLMRCYAASGERGQAIRHYEELVELLDEELGSFPALETSALYERLRRGEDV